MKKDEEEILPRVHLLEWVASTKKLLGMTLKVGSIMQNL